MTLRVVSLVPSLTETVAALGCAGSLVGVTRYCVRGAPPSAARVGGSKYPDLEAVLALAPDLVLANAEENRREDIEVLRAAGIEALVTFPRTVDDVPGVLRALAAVLQADGEPLAQAVETAAAEAEQQRPDPPLRALTLVWRKPWMAAGRDTYVSDLLSRCGLANALSPLSERYPRLRPGEIPAADVVLLPSEPYAFGPDDLDAVADLAPGVPAEFVDGQLLTWHGPRTAEALRVFTALACRLRQ